MDHCIKIKRKQHPRERANILSKLVFYYTKGFFVKALKHDLEEDDLYDVIKDCNSKRCGNEIEKQWIKENEKSKKGSIYKLLWEEFGWRYLLIGVVDLCYKLYNILLRPLAISKLISYFDVTSKLTKEECYFWAFMVLLNSIINTIYFHNSLLWAQTLGLEMRTSFSAMLYRKALRLTPSAMSKINLGNLVTLITKDVYAFQVSIWMINDMWNGTIQIIVVCIILYNRIGPSSFIGIGIILFVLPIQVIIGKIISRYRLQTCQKTDERLQQTQETLSTIRIIKMYTWELFFRNKVDEARAEETKKILITYHLRVCQIIIGVLFSKLGFYFLIMSYIWLGYGISTELVFWVASIFKQLESDLGELIPNSMGRAAELYSAVKRINQVITAEELPPREGSDKPTDKPLLELKNANVHINQNVVLKNINFETDYGLTLITGRVGSGKSSLLKALLEDYPLDSGYLLSRGRISYASQDPWLFPSTIKQNIIFGEKYDEKRYLEVVRVCALEFDFNLFDKGDDTIVCDRGMNLSKGQQARINLARAVYKDSEIYLLDDSLTALDSQVQDYIFKECIQQFLKDKMCILVTQNINQLKSANIVVLMENSEIKASGKPTEKFLESINRLITEETKTTEDVEQLEYKKENCIHEEESTSSEDTELLENEQCSKQKIYAEKVRKGKVSTSIYRKYLLYGGGVLFLILNLFMFGLAQGFQSLSEYLLSRWVNKQQVVLSYENATENVAYTNAVDQSDLIIKLYSGSIFAEAIFDAIRTFTILEMGRRASVNLHKVIMAKMTEARMAFFDTHFLGNILNRFSQDLNNVDEQVPFVIFQFLKVAFILTAILIVMSTIKVSFLALAVVIFISLYFMRKAYLPTGRSLKRLETCTRSPMVGHINASLEGVTTIRAYKVQRILVEEFDRHQDLFTSAHYTWLCSTYAFGFSIDVMCSLFVTVVVLTLVLIDVDNNAGDVGLAVTQVMALVGKVEWGVRQWADLESLMTSVERLLDYAEIKSETNEGNVKENWPQDGGVVYKNVSLSYTDNQPILKNLSFEIKPKEKVGIVGRTGAGKSSIIASIFRLYEAEGNIYIDGVDSKSLRLDFLRRNISIIPQDPILFSGTIRTNLDPFEEFTDSKLWAVLDKVGIKNIIPSLDFKVKSYASSYSSGQRQLLSVARAILRKNKIVILDEATANMDHETDDMLCKIIQENFVDCTVFTIAHRLETIINCDKVMVLDRGEIKELDSPANLLQNKNGIFYSLAQQAGVLN